MMGTFYIASSRDRIDDVRRLSRLLTMHGMRNAFAWPEHFDHRCATETCGIGSRAELARLELNAAASCDLFIGIDRMGKGTHVELGAALTMRGVMRRDGRDKRVILVGVDRTDLVFYDADKVEHAADVETLFAMLGIGSEVP